MSRVAGAAQRVEGGLHGASHPCHALRPPRGGEQGAGGGEFWEAVRLCREAIVLSFSIPSRSFGIVYLTLILYALVIEITMQRRKNVLIHHQQ